MKTPQSRIRIISLSVIALIALAFVSNTFAKAADYYLEFKDDNGKVTKVTISKDGSFSSPKLSQGTYTLSWVFNNRPRQTTSVDDAIGGRNAVGNGSAGHNITSSTGSSTERKNKIDAIAVHYEIVSPRDPTSGLPTGKRMHKPFNFSVTDSERLLPTVNKKVGTIAIDEPGVQVTGIIEVKDQFGNKMAVDDWQM